MDVARPRGKPRSRGSARWAYSFRVFSWFVFFPLFTEMDAMRFSVDAPETVNDEGPSVRCTVTPGEE